MTLTSRAARAPGVGRRYGRRRDAPPKPAGKREKERENGVYGRDPVFSEATGTF